MAKKRVVKAWAYVAKRDGTLWIVEKTKAALRDRIDGMDFTPYGQNSLSKFLKITPVEIHIKKTNPKRQAKAT